MVRIVILSLSFLFCITLQAQDIGGSWGCKAPKDEDGTSWVFSLLLWRENNKYRGEYIFTTQYGRRIKTGVVKIASMKGNKAKLILNCTSHPLFKGPENCEIKLLPNGKLFFNYSNAKKDYALPDSVFMHRTRTEKELIEIRKQRKTPW